MRIVYLAIEYNHRDIEVIKYLHQINANFIELDNLKNNAFHVAASMNRFDILTWLI